MGGNEHAMVPVRFGGGREGRRGGGGGGGGGGDYARTQAAAAYSARKDELDNAPLARSGLRFEMQGSGLGLQGSYMCNL